MCQNRSPVLSECLESVSIHTIVRRQSNLPRHHKRNNRREAPRRRAEQERDRARIPQRRRKSRKERVERQRDDHAREREGEAPHFPVRDGHPEARDLARVRDAALLVRDADILQHALLRELHLERAQPPVRRRGKVGQDEDRADGDEDRERALDEEEPSAGPAC